MEVKNKICSIICAICALICCIIIPVVPIIDDYPILSFLEYTELTICGLIISLFLVLILMTASSFTSDPDKSLYIASLVGSLTVLIIYSVLTNSIREVPVYSDQDFNYSYSVVLLGILFIMIGTLITSSIFSIIDLLNHKYVKVEKVEQSNSSTTTVVITPSAPKEEPKDEFLMRLDRLKSLKEQGYITDEEYEAKRKEIIANTKF